MDKSPLITEVAFADVINLLSELVVFNQYDFNQFLKRLITIIVKVIPADSCLIYFYDHSQKKLILVGSKKPHDQNLENIFMREGEGITGWAAQHQQTVAIAEKAYLDERFKSFKELPEDKFESFLSVPIINGNGTIGVINIQNKDTYVFSKQEIKTIESIVQIITSGFEKTLLQSKIAKLETQLQERKVIEKAKGVLMKIKKISEEEAFAFIRKEAMDKRKTMKEIADAILLLWQ